MRRIWKYSAPVLFLTLLLSACGVNTATPAQFTTAASTPVSPVSPTPTTRITPPASSPTAVFTPAPVLTPTSPPPTPTLKAIETPLPEVIPPALARSLIESKARQVILALKNSDMNALSTFVDPVKGLRFSPYSYVSAENLVFTPAQLKTLNGSATIYHWGIFDGSGKPMDLSFNDYYARFVYSHDFANALEVGYNQILGRGNTLENSAEFYPHSIVVEYHFPGFEKQYEGLDWKSLRLVFQNPGGNWNLVGIIHDKWTI